jgi:hypothetical protein
MSMPPELRAMMERYCQLGRLLPQRDDMDLEDPRAGAEAELILAQIDDFLAAAKHGHRRGRMTPIRLTDEQLAAVTRAA